MLEYAFIRRRSTHTMSRRKGITAVSADTISHNIMRNNSDTDDGIIENGFLVNADMTNQKADQDESGKDEDTTMGNPVMIYMLSSAPGRRRRKGQ